MNLKRTFFACVLTLALGLSSTSCLGPDNAYRSIKNWNAEMSDQDWLNEVVFLAMYIIPVYPIVMLGDLLIFNTVEYWSGNNPINDPGAFKKFTSKD